MKYVELEAFQIRQLAVLQISLLCTGSTTLKQAQSSVFSVTHTYPDKTPYISTLVAIGDKKSLIEEVKGLYSLCSLCSLMIHEKHFGKCAAGMKTRTSDIRFV